MFYRLNFKLIFIENKINFHFIYFDNKGHPATILHGIVFFKSISSGGLSMKKLLLIISLFSFGFVNADVTHSWFRGADCYSDDGETRSNCSASVECQSCACDSCDFESELSDEQIKTAQKVVKGIFSDQFIKSLVTFARQSQIPIKDFLRSTFAATQLNIEQLEAIKKEVQMMCDVYPQLIVLGLQYTKIKEEQRMQLIEKHFAQELAQNKCFMMYGFLSINPEGLTGEEAKSLEEKIQAVLAPFEEEFEKTHIAQELRAVQEKASKSFEKCATVIPALRDSIGDAIQANQEQLKLVGMMLLSSLSKGISNVITQAVDEQIKEIKA